MKSKNEKISDERSEKNGVKKIMNGEVEKDKDTK